MAGALNYKATAMRNFKRQHDRIFSWLRRMGEWLQDLCITTRCHLEMTFFEIFRWKVKKGKFHICHFVRPCQNHVGRVLEIGNCTKVFLKLCLSGQIVIKPLFMIVRTGKT